MGVFSSIIKAFTNLLGDIVGFLIGVDFDDFEDQARGALLNKQSNIDPIPVVYGKRKVGGVRVFVSTGGGKKNEFLHIALVLCEGEIQAIDEIYVNDKLHTHADYSGLITVDKKLGSDSQAHSAILTTADDSWGTNHTLSGVAYLAIKIKYDADVFGGIPDIQCVIRGKKVYDPRTNTTSYSTNPALCLRDYLTNTRYGKGLPASAINDTMFNDAADDYDAAEITPYTADPAPLDIKLIECNARLDTGRTIFSNVKELLQGMRGLMPYSEGQYGLIFDQAASSTFNLTPDNITSDITVQNAGKGKRFNRVIAKFPNPDANWQLDSVTFPKAGSSDETTFLSEDNGEELIKEVQLNTITNLYQARDIARIVCLASRKNVNAVSLKATSEAMDIAIGDVVNLEHPSLGWTGAATQNMRVVGTQLLDNGEVSLSLLEYNGSIYPFAQGDEAEDNQDTTLPDPFDVGAPQAPITATERVILGPDGSYQSAVTLAWGAADDAFVTEYEVQWRKSTDSVFENNARTEETEIDIFNLEVNQTPGSEITYYFRVRSVNALGIRSAYLEMNQALAGDVTAPGLPGGVTATPGINSITLTWDNPTDSDFKHCEVYVAKFNILPANPTSIIDGEIYTQIGLGGGDQRYFWLKSVDFSGNKSAATSPVNATALNVTSGDIEPGDIAGRNLSMLLNVYADGVTANAGEGALVGVNVDGTPNYDNDGFVFYDGEKITIEHDQYTNVTGSFTFLTSVSDKQGFIVFDINKTKPFTITNGPTDMDCAFVWVENDVYYYDTNSSAQSFDPSTITGNTTGADYKTGTSTTVPHLVAIGAIKTTSNSAGDDIIAGGLFADPIDLEATEIAEGVIVGRHIAAQTIGADKLTVNNLAAISANLGTITAGTINASTVTISNLQVDDLSGDINVISAFEGPTNGGVTKTWGPTSAGYVQLATVTCLANDTGKEHTPILNMVLSGAFATDTAYVKVESRVSGGTFAQVAEVRHKTASGGNSWTTIPLSASHGSTTTSDVEFKVSIKMYGDNGTSSTSQSRTGVTYYYGTLLGVV